MNMGKFEGKTAVVTGGAHGIGKAIAERFRKEGARVFIIDLKPGEWFTGDVGKKEDLEAFRDCILEQTASVDYLINNAMPITRGIDTCSYEEFSYGQQ